MLRFLTRRWSSYLLRCLRSSFYSGSGRQIALMTRLLLRMEIVILIFLLGGARYVLHAHDGISFTRTILHPRLEFAKYAIVVEI